MYNYRSGNAILQSIESSRGHGVKLTKKQCRPDIRKFLFPQRTVNEWKRLLADCIDRCSSVNMYKNVIVINL